MTVNEPWVERERRTSRLIRACYSNGVADDAPTADQLYGLCKLTWITKGGDRDLPDNTARVVAPALSAILGIDIDATTPSELSKQLRAHNIDDSIIRHVGRPVGFTNFYGGFRNVARGWIEENLSSVTDIVRRVASGGSDHAIREAYRRIEQLPSLPRPNAGALPAFNLLTPTLACLDPRVRAPIINSRDAVKRRLRMLGLSSASLAQQHDGLVGLIGQAGIADAFDLDTADDEQIERAMKRATKPPKPKLPNRMAATGGGKPLDARRDEDVEFLRAADTVRMRQIHNRMTNALRVICESAGLVLEEGSEQTCLYDALIRAYLGTERHLLIEVKTDDSSPMSRMAVGQLLDYRRLLEDRAATDLAVLFPSEPAKDTCDFLTYVGVNVLWFDDEMVAVKGDVRFGGKI